MARDLASQLIPSLQERGFSPVLEADIAAETGFPKFGRTESELLKEIDLVLVLGGDGSMLNAARMVYPRQIPLLGINLGHLGFLTMIESHHLDSALDDLEQGYFQFEDRAMLEAKIFRKGAAAGSFIALNDIVITKNSFSRIIRLKTWIDDEYITTYPGDGLIIATATGSTAYSLSAGGPILDPRIKSILMTPICAHSLYARPMVLSEDACIKILAESSQAEVQLTTDGQVGANIQEDDEILVCKAKAVTRLLRFNSQGLYEALKSRLKEGRI